MNLTILLKLILAFWSICFLIVAIVIAVCWEGFEYKPEVDCE